ncbi:MAG TPA: hypothetical protein VFK48_08845 [Usitatibacter sp.]|nr:hypothetical protein [Usitatibacter sp.]
MRTRWITLLVAGALGAAGSATVLAQAPRYSDDFSFRVGRAPDWNLSAADGVCRLRIWVDDRAQVQLRGDQIVVRTDSGRRSYDQGSVCNQPLPFGRVEDFRVTAERARGSVFDVSPPNRRNNFTGTVRIDDPQNGGEVYDLVVAWRNADGPPPAPIAANEPFPYFDETRACQDRVRGDFLARNREGDAYIEFHSVPVRDDVGPNRERIRGEAYARSRFESRPLTYECVLNERNNRVLSSSYEVLPRGRVSYLR